MWRGARRAVSFRSRSLSPVRQSLMPRRELNEFFARPSATCVTRPVGIEEKKKRERHREHHRQHGEAASVSSARQHTPESSRVGSRETANDPGRRARLSLGERAASPNHRSTRGASIADPARPVASRCLRPRRRTRRTRGRHKKKKQKKPHSCPSRGEMLSLGHASTGCGVCNGGERGTRT